MNRNLSILLIPLVLFSLIPSLNYAQSKQTEDTYYNWFDTLVGVENTGLYDGIIYKEAFRTRNEKTKFFKSPDFLSGSVFYDGQWYHDQDIKFDVYEDQLLLKIKKSLGGITIKLFKEKIPEFIIDGHPFLQVNGLAQEVEISGFHELSLKNEYFTLYIKHFKKDFSRKDRSSIYYEFLDKKKQYVLLKNNTYHIIKTKKNLTKLFPNQKKEIDSFYNVARSLRNSDPDAFLLALMKRMETLLSQENNAVTE